MKKPIVLRLKGKGFDKVYFFLFCFIFFLFFYIFQAKKIIHDCGFNILVTEDWVEATEKAIKMAQILRMARDARININLLS